MTTKQAKPFRKVLVRKAPKKEHFTAAELIADLRSEMTEQIDSLEQRVAALERKAEEAPDDPDER